MSQQKVWFITGISRGLGRALAEGMLAAGDHVIGTTRSGAADFSHERLTVLPLEVTDAAQAADTVAKAHAVHGRVDVVVNNAGYGLLGPVEATAPREYEHLMNVNFDGTVRVTQAALPLLRQQPGGGHIINMSSIAGLAPSGGYAFYAAAKFAVVGFSVALAQEVAPLGVRVTCVAPGAFRTDFLDDSSIRWTEKELEPYAESRRAVQQHFETMAGKQLGDPARATDALRKLVASDNPPRVLLLGSDAVERWRAMNGELTSDIDAWQGVSVSTDFSND